MRSDWRYLRALVAPGSAAEERRRTPSMLEGRLVRDRRGEVVLALTLTQMQRQSWGWWIWWEVGRSGMIAAIVVVVEGVVGMVRWL